MKLSKLSRISRRPTFVLSTTIASALASAGIAATVLLTGNDLIGVSSFNTGTNWSDGLAPSAGNDYVTGAFQLRTPVNPTSAIFAGDSLTISAGGSFGFKTAGPTTVNNLILAGGLLGQSLTGAVPEEAKLGGGLTVTANSTIDTTTGTGRIFTFDSLIHGTGGLTLTGATGTVNFNNTANDYTGVITIGGALSARSVALVVPTLTNGGLASPVGAQSAAASNLVLDGGTFRTTTGAAVSTDRLFTVTNFGGAIESSGLSPVTFSNTGAVAFSGSGTRTLTIGGTNTGANIFNPSIGDSGGATSVTKSGASVWTLTANNTFTGTLSVNGGILEFSNLGNIGDLSAPISFNGGTLRWAAGNASTISGRVVTLAGAGTLNTNGSNVLVSSVIGGVGSLTKAGTGILTLTGTNTFAGNVSVGNSNGSIRITSSDSLGRGVKTISIVGNQGTDNAPLLRLDGSNGPIILPASFSFTTSNDGLNGNPNAPAIVNEAGANVINGNFTLTSGGGGTRFLLNGGSLTLNGNLTPNMAGRVALFSGTGNGTANGVIQDQNTTNVLGVTKDGTGTWVLNGANTYTAATTVSAGRLLTNTASFGSSVTVASGASFGVRVATAGQTFSAPSLTLNAGSTGLSFDFGILGNATAPVITAATFAPNSGVTVTFNGANLVAGSFPLIKYTTLGGAGFGALNLILPPRAAASLVDNPGNSSVDLNIASIDYPRWTGANGSAWDTATQNWKEIGSGNATNYIEGTAGGSDAVLFDNDPSVLGNVVNLSSTLSPAAVTVNNPTADYLFTGPGKLSGTTGLTKLGARTLVLANSGVNDYSGVTRINAGVLQLGDGATVGAGQFGSGPIINNALLVLSRPDDFYVANVIGGSGGITKVGTNTVTIAANNTFDGPIVISAGTLRIGAATALGSTAGNTTVFSGATLATGGQNLGSEVIRIVGTGVGGLGALVNNTADQLQSLRFLTLSGNATIGGTNRIDIRTNGGGETLDLAGFKLTKIGAARFSIVGTTVTPGDFDITAGSVQIEAASVVQGTGAFTYSAGTTAFYSGTTGTNITRVMVWNGNAVDSAGAVGAINSPIILGGNVAINATANTFTIGGPIIGTGFGLTKIGAGTVLLSGTDPNTFTGLTTITAGVLQLGKTSGTAISGDVIANAGTLQLTAAGQFAPDTSVTINQGATWTGGNFFQAFKNLTINTATLQTVNNLNLSGTLSFTAGLQDLSSGQSITANQLSISGGATYRLGANSADTIVNIGAGGLTLAGGTLQLGQLGGGFVAQVNLGGNLTASGTSAIFNPNVAGPRNVDLGGATRDFNITGGTTSVSPNIQNGSLTKSGAGTLVLSGTNTYTGDTTVNGGTLLVNGSIAGTVLVNSGTLGGSGLISGTVLVSGTLAPGNSPGSLALNNTDLLLSSTAVSVFELGSTVNFDRVIGINNLTLDGTFNVTLFGGYSPALNDSFDLLDFNNIDSTGFNLASDLILPSLGAGLAWDTGNFTSFGVLTVIPEPGSASLLLAGLSMFVGLRRRRR